LGRAAGSKCPFTASAIVDSQLQLGERLTLTGDAAGPEHRPSVPRNRQSPRKVPP
jgi:hypothetical protein